MSRKTVLFADNNPDFLQTRAEFLQKEGYQIIFANSPAAAEQIMEDTNVHLAILDVRLVDDENEKDISGILLAQKEEFRGIPKIILTGFPSPYTSRDALKLHLSGFQPAINYIGKEERQDALITAVNEAFTHHVRINWNLVIDWKARDSISLVRLIESNLEGKRLLNRAEEFQDLFRRLFYEKNQIRVERLLWERDGRVALIVFAFKDGMTPESFVVVCGQNAMVNQEAKHFENFSPDAPGESGTRLNARAETTHFAANAYAFAGNDLEKVQTLSELYRFGPPNIFREALTTLFQRTLSAWHQDKPMREKNSLEYFYRQRLGLQYESPAIAHVIETISVIESQIATRGVRVERAGGKVLFHFNGQSFSYSDALPLLTQSLDSPNPTVLITIPGTLTGENVLADEAGRTWLTDFVEAGTAPLFWNFVSLEAVIRFDWVETIDLLRRQELEHNLINTDIARPDLRDLESQVRKPAQTISNLRRLAARIVGQNALDYHLGIFFQAARRLADHRTGSPLTILELTRLTHAWLAMTMIAEKIMEGQVENSGPLVKVARELRILDEKARMILVDNREIRLPPQPFALLNYLYGKANQVCTRVELLNEVLQGKYDESYLHTLIGRLRKAIEEDVEQPRFLITEPNAGYRLIPKPK